MIDTTRIRAYANKNILTAWTVQAWAFVYNSDKRLKTNIKDLNDSNDILKISAKRFDWKDEKNKKVPKNDIWVIAQDVEKYFPEFVETDEIEVMRKKIKINIKAIELQEGDKILSINRQR